jgi:micrococcal nuclease
MPIPRTVTIRRALGHLVGAVLLATASCARPVPDGPAPLPEGGVALPAAIVATVDGDTVELRFGDGHRDRARLLGVDTPETVHPDRPVECFGREASARTAELLPAGTEVLVQRDTEARDRYGRLLVYVWRRTDGLFVNRSLVEDGFARTLSISPNTARRADLSAAAHRAEVAGAGLWGACPPTSGRDP